MPVMADPDRIEQVLTNLIDNALKYSPPDTTVELILGGDEELVRLSVRDQGIGVAPESLDAIFEPFGRAANAEETGATGLGLGLYICRTIIERLGGSIWAESEGEGAGLTVNIQLPPVPKSSGVSQRGIGFGCRHRPAQSHSPSDPRNPLVRPVHHDRDHRRHGGRGVGRPSSRAERSIPVRCGSDRGHGRCRRRPALLHRARMAILCRSSGPDRRRPTARADDPRSAGRRDRLLLVALPATRRAVSALGRHDHGRECRLARRSAAGATGRTRKRSAGQRACRGASRSIPPTGRPNMRRPNDSTRRSCTSRSARSSIAAILVYVLLHFAKRAWWRDGYALALYLVLYGGVRLVIESMRTDSLYIGPWPAAYWLSGALIIGGCALALFLRPREVNRVEQP